MTSIHTLTIEGYGVVIALRRETPGFGLPSQLNARLDDLWPGEHFSVKRSKIPENIFQGVQ